MSTCSYCGGELTAGSQRCDYCGAPVIQSAPKQNFNQPQSYNQAPGFNNSQSYNQAPGFNYSQGYNQAPSFNNTPDFNNTPSFNQAPSFNQSPVFNQPPVTNGVADARCPICGALIVPGSTKCPYCNNLISHQPSYSQPMGYEQNQPMGYGQGQGFNQSYNQGYNQPMKSQPQRARATSGSGLIRSSLLAFLAIMCAIVNPISANILGIVTIITGYSKLKSTKNLLPLFFAVVSEVIVVFISMAYWATHGTLM